MVEKSMKMVERVGGILEHYEKHEMKYKYLVFPILWILSVYFVAFLFYRSVVFILAIVAQTL